MVNTRSTLARPRWYRGNNVPLALIRRFASQVAERFDPEKIILFGSHAYGTPHADSDVDIMVIMTTRNQIDQACRIDDAFDPPFPLDLVVRTPKNLARRLAEGDSFLRDVMARGMILYVSAVGGEVPQGAIGRTWSAHTSDACLA